MKDYERVVNVHDLARLQGTLAMLRQVVEGLRSELGDEAPNVSLELAVTDGDIAMLNRYRKAAA